MMWYFPGKIRRGALWIPKGTPLVPFIPLRVRACPERRLSCQKEIEPSKRGFLGRWRGECGADKRVHGGVRRAVNWSTLAVEEVGFHQRGWETSHQRGWERRGKRSHPEHTGAHTPLTSCPNLCRLTTFKWGQVAQKYLCCWNWKLWILFNQICPILGRKITFSQCRERATSSGLIGQYGSQSTAYKWANQTSWQEHLYNQLILIPTC